MHLTEIAEKLKQYWGEEISAVYVTLQSPPVEGLGVLDMWRLVVSPILFVVGVDLGFVVRFNALIEGRPYYGVYVTDVRSALQMPDGLFEMLVSRKQGFMTRKTIEHGEHGDIHYIHIELPRDFSLRSELNFAKDTPKIRG